MAPVLCILGGCNGAGKTTLARELLPRLGLMRFLNADEIARGLSPLDPSLSAFRAGRLFLQEAQSLIAANSGFALESTLSGTAQLALIHKAKACGYRIVLHYIVIGSASQAIERVALRVKLGGHNVPTADVQRRFDRSRRHFLNDYLPLADEWVLWDNSIPPHRRIMDSTTNTTDELQVMLTSSKLQETHPREMSDMVRIGLEAGRVATEKMLDLYKRMGIEVTPQMTLVAESDMSSRLNSHHEDRSRPPGGA